MKFKYANINDGNIEKHRRSGQESHFPLEWFDKYPAENEQDSLLQTSDGDLVVETRNFEQVIIYLNLDPARDPSTTRRLVQELMNTLLQDKHAGVAPSQSEML
jgi:hypothetical protein